MRTYLLKWIFILLVAKTTHLLAEDALVLRVPFDNSLEAVGSAGPVKHEGQRVEFEAGRFGQAVRVAAGGSLYYHIERLVEPHKGTLSLWLKLSRAIADTDDAPYGRIVHVQSAEEGFFNTFFRISSKSNKGLSIDLFGLGDEYDTFTAQGFGYEEGVKGWKADQWHHVVVAWHCGKGIRIYDNGAMKFSNWGKARWVPATPTMLYLNSHPKVPATNAAAFDEVRIYAEPLDDGQVAALYRGEDVRMERVAERFEQVSVSYAAWVQKELASASELPSITLSGGPSIVRQHLALGAKVRKVSRREATDGHARTNVQLAAPLEIELAEGSVEFIELDGPSPDAALHVEGKDILPPGTGKCVRRRLPTPIRTKRLTLVPRTPGTRISEARFYSLEKGAAVSDATPKILTVSGVVATGDLNIPGNPAAGPLYTMPQEALLATETGQPTNEMVCPRVDILTEPFPTDTGVKAVGLELRLAEFLPTIARMKLTTASESDRALFRLDARIEAAAGVKEGDLCLIMDWPEFILHKGERIWFTAIFDKPVKIAYGGKMLLYTAPPDAVKAEYVARLLGWFVQWYSVAAEAHAWDFKGWQPTPEIRWLENILKADPGNLLARAYYNRIFHRESEVQVTIPGPEKAPMWARAEREALRRTADVVHWWIDNRQTEDGQFGGGWNDDVELHGWDLLVLGCGDQKVLTALRKLNDGIWSPERFTHGYSNRIWDVEHAAEDSSYSQPRMVALEYGNPKWLERCMETIKNFDFWTAINPKGHRHFRSFMFQAQKIREGPEYDSDMADCARAMKPGNYVLWYNGNELVKKWFCEWADAWCADSLKTERGKPPGILPAEIVFATCELGRGNRKWNEGLKYPLGAITYHTEDQLITAYMCAKDRKYLAPIEAMIERTSVAESTAVTWRRLTGDKRFDERFIATAKNSAGGANFIAWLATGDKKFLADGCVETVRRYEQTRFLLTEAEPPTDRVSLPGNQLLRQMLLGGVAVWVCGWPQMAVSWQETGYDFAALVLESAPKRLKILAYNFGPTRKVKMATWELERGDYEMNIGPDGNRDDMADTIVSKTQVAVERGLPIEVVLPGDELSVIELTQLTAKPLGKVADLALCGEDVKFSADGRKVTIQVHNIGSVPARNIAVAVVDESGQRVAGGTIPEINSPDDLIPQIKTIEMDLPTAAPRALRIILDPKDEVPEITEVNNSVRLER